MALPATRALAVVVGSVSASITTTTTKNMSPLRRGSESFAIPRVSARRAVPDSCLSGIRWTGRTRRQTGMAHPIRARSLYSACPLRVLRGKIGAQLERRHEAWVPVHGIDRRAVGDRRHRTGTGSRRGTHAGARALGLL